MATMRFAVRLFQLVAYVISGGLGGSAIPAGEFDGIRQPRLHVLAKVRRTDCHGDFLGGVGTLDGAIIGTAVYLGAEEWLSGRVENWQVIFGPLLVLGRAVRARRIDWLGLAALAMVWSCLSRASASNA